MDIKQNPFSLYDFLGYFVPGAFFLYLLLITWGHINAYSSPTEVIVNHLNFKSPELYPPFIILSYIVGHFLSFLSSITIEKYAVWKFDYPSKYLLDLTCKRYFQVDKPKYLRICIRCIVGFFILPITILDFILGKSLVQELYAKKLDEKLRGVLHNKIKAIIEKECGIKADEDSLSKKDFFRYLDHYALENAPNHLRKMQNYIALYGFLRTVSLIAVIFFWILLWHAFYIKGSVLNSFILLTIYSSFVYVFFMAFVKFYRRYTLEVLMAVSVVYKK